MSARLALICIMSDRSHRRVVLMVALMATALLALALPPRAAAQTCTADVQCRSGRLSDNVCIGDTLYVKRRLCIGGRCEEQDVRRETCRTGGSADRCVGNVYERDGGRCDALAGRCTNRLERQACTKSCSCRGKLLIVASGQCAPGVGCIETVLECKTGCTCRPEPMCLEKPAKGK
jgi:hypothetical protein